jgi:hypothetical protein
LAARAGFIAQWRFCDRANPNCEKGDKYFIYETLAEPLTSEDRPDLKSYLTQAKLRNEAHRIVTKRRTRLRRSQRNQLGDFEGLRIHVQVWDPLTCLLAD